MEVHQCRGPQNLEYLSGYDVNWLDAPICRSCLAVIGENLRKTAEKQQRSTVERIHLWNNDESKCPNNLQPDPYENVWPDNNLILV